MIIEREVKTVKTELESITCDKCGKIYVYNDENILELQEFHHIHFVGGYASVFGDETRGTCDLCQHCLKELIGKYCYYDGEKIVA